MNAMKLVKSDEAAAAETPSPAAVWAVLEIIDVLAVLNVLPVAFPPKVISDLHDG